MSTSMQNFLADATMTVANNFIAAVLNLPEDKRLWRPSENARPALSLVAECALNNGYLVPMIETRQWAGGPMEEYFQTRDALMHRDWATLEALFRANTEQCAAYLRTVPDDALTDEVQMPFGKFTVREMIAYPHWNMSYHEGQVNYIASLLGELK